VPTEGEVELETFDPAEDGRSLYVAEHMSLAVDDRGNPILHDFAYPERKLRITENERVLLSCFRSSEPTAVVDAISTYLRHVRQEQLETTVNAAGVMLKRLVDAGILVRGQKSGSPYTEKMIASYCSARRIPRQVCNNIIRTAGVTRETHILDIATGTGEIARQLAETSNHVVGIDSSVNFVNTARLQARSQSHPPKFVRACANKLVLHEDTYDVVTLCQAFHWLNPALAVRGLHQVVKQDGLLFLIESKSMLPVSHPLRTVLKYGDSNDELLTKECVRQANWYSRLFDLLRRPGWLFRLSQIALFRERRIFNIEFARAFFFEAEVRSALGTQDQPWTQLADIFSGRSSSELTGELFWLVMCFENASVGRGHPAREVSHSEIEFLK